MIKADLHMGANQYYEHRFFKDQFQNTVQPPQPPLVAHNAVISKHSGNMQECPSYDYTSEQFRARWRPEGMRDC